jgi:hypothetical protein
MIWLGEIDWILGGGSVLVWFVCDREEYPENVIEKIWGCEMEQWRMKEEARKANK